MAGLNRAMFCLACGEIIPEASLESHITANPDHALIKYHHNLHTGGGDPVGAVISGSLNGSKRLHVDGNRTDTDTPETGTPAQPFQTIQAAVDYGVATFAGPFTLSIEQALYLEEVVMPDYVTIDSAVGAVLRRPPGPTPSDALTITGTYGDPEAAFGAAVLRGLRIVSDGDDGSGGTVESWCVRLVGDASGAPDVREPFVVAHVCSFDALNEGNYLFSEGGAFFLTGDGGMGGDETGGVGIKLKPQPDLSCMCLCGTQMVAFGTHGLEIYENSFFVGNGTRFQAMSGHSSPTQTCIKMDATAGFSLVSIYQPSQMFGDPTHFIDAVGGGGGGPPSALITLHGGYNDIFDGVGGDAVTLSDGVLLRFVDGGIRSAGGRGIVLDNALMWIRNANVVSGDGYALEVRGDNSNVDSIDTTYDGFSGGPGSPSYGPCVLVDVLTSSVSFTGGRMRGDVTVLDVLRGSAYLLGGVDLDPANPASTAYHVAPGANIQRGHCNVRRGQRVVDPTGSESLLPSSFGEIQVGFFNCVAKFGSSLTPPGGSQGWEQGSLWVSPGDPIFQLYQNIGNEAAPDWKAISNGLMSGLGSPNGSVTGYAGLFYRDTATDQIWICVQDNSTVWILVGAGAGVGGLEMMIAEHRENAGVDAAAFTSGAWRTRTLNVERFNNSSDISINTGTYEITLAEGHKYLVEGWGVADNVDVHKTAFQVDGSRVIIGGNGRTSNTLHVTASMSALRGVVDLTAAGSPASCYLVHQTNTNGTFGEAHVGGFGVDEVYAHLTIRKLPNILPPPTYITGIGNPNGVVTGVGGQIYRDTGSGVYYICQADGSDVWDVL